MYILNDVLLFKFNILYLCIGSKTSVVLLCIYPLLPKLKILICNVYFYIEYFIFYIRALIK
jgi:hypothetical protein